MKKTAKILVVLLVLLLVLTGCSSEKKTNSQSAAFTPKLDTQKEVSLEMSVMFGNFEALDQVINHFSEFYPNVKITYEQLFTGRDVPDFIQNHPYIDIFMTSNKDGYPTEDCADLLTAGVDVSAVADGMLRSTTVDGKLLSLPMGLILKGMVVNKTLLKKEGLTMPQTWDEFLNVLDALKQKGYTPIQGPQNVISTLFYDMGMAMINENPDLAKAVYAGDVEGASSLKIIYERLLELYEKGYFSDEVNAEYPKDNYNDSIMKFLEGDVPFWVCDTEKVSGMRKRESKSEAFSANPFEYEFTFVPVGDKGVYEYYEPWYGFAVNKNAEDYDYAIEFLRFMAREDELNTLASVKGVPSIAKNSSDTRYTNLDKIEKVELASYDNGSLYSFTSTYMINAGNDMLTVTKDAEVALTHFVNHCVETITEMNNP